jgi:hypothetical protein
MPPRTEFPSRHAPSRTFLVRQACLNAVNADSSFVPAYLSALTDRGNSLPHWLEVSVQRQFHILAASYQVAA